jgi:hypothetical protein
VDAGPNDEKEVYQGEPGARTGAEFVYSLRPVLLCTPGIARGLFYLWPDGVDPNINGKKFLDE